MTHSIETKDLQLGDVVRALGNTGPWSTCIVKQVENDRVHLHRPYGHKADFSHTGGVICYTGIEEYTVEIASDYQWVLFERVTLK